MSASGPAEDQLARRPADADGQAGPSRRRLLTGAGWFGAGAVAGGLTGYFTRPEAEPSAAAGADPSQQVIPFYGAHQAGIITPAQASPEHNGGTRILRRGYSFTDGIDPQAGTLLGGLFFIAFMKSPAQFIHLQQALAGDALNEYIHHTGSAVFACPPGLRPGQHWGDTLFT